MNRPNILVFLTDDHGRWASSAYGNSEIQSPVMQWMADTGVRMDQAYCPSPVCSPARASFWTGLIPSAHGIHDWILDNGTEDEEAPTIEGRPTLARFIKDAGYRTGLVGKWHCGSFWRKQDGFDTWFTSAKGTNARFGEQTYYEDEHLQTYHGHQETILTDRAVRFLREHAQKGETTAAEPFFLFVGYTNTHTSHSGENAAVVNQYRKCSFADIPDVSYNNEHGHPRIAPFRRSDPERHEQLAQYYAAVHVIDQQMARIVEELENLGQLDNTLIVYTSDHGHMNGHHGLHTKGNATIPVNLLDESIQVPLLMRWPGTIQPGTTVDIPVDHCDLFALLLDTAGVDVGGTANMLNAPGRSYLPALKGETLPWRDYQICDYAYSRMVRTRAHKLIRRYPNKVTRWPDAFYDLASDPDENRNVIDDPRYADVIRELDTVMEHHFSQYAVPELEGINMETIRKHNIRDPWESMPGDDDHRQ